MDPENESGHEYDSIDEIEEQQPQEKKTRGTTTLKKFKGKREIQFNELGQAIGPNQTKFGLKCGSLARRKIGILFDSWRKVPPEDKDQLWLEIKAWWGIPNDEAKVQVLRQCSERWKAFKTTLRRDYMDKGKSPLDMYTFLEESKWVQFVAKENTEEKRLKRDQGKETARLKKNPPRLGSKGYRGHEVQWDEEAKSKKLLTTVHKIEDPRARHYLLGHTFLDEDGYMIVPPDVQENVKELQQLKNTEFAPGSDLLTSLLKTNEHGGRTRAVGYTVGLKKGIPGYDKKKRKTRETVEELREQLRESNSQKEKLQAQVDLLKSRQQGSTSMEENLHVINLSPSKSSHDYDSRLAQLDKIVQPTKCAPTQVDVPVVETRPMIIDSDLAAYLEQLDKLKEPTKCALISPNVPEQIPCAVGRVYPAVSGLLLHGKPLTPGYMKVQVDDVNKEYGDLKLPSPMEGIEKLIDARNTFIEWPKTRIRFFKASTKTVATTLKSVNEGTSIETSKQPTRSTPHPYPASTATTATLKSSMTKGTSTKLLKEPTKIAPNLYPELEKHRKMIDKEKPMFIRAFYDRWMKRENPNLGVVISPEEVFGLSVCKQCIVASDDLMCLLTNDWLDMSIITYFTMSLHKSIQKPGNKCALLNPYEIHGTQCDNDMARVTDYLLNAINTREKDKMFFLAPYYERDHWVLFTTTWGTYWILLC